MNGLTSRQMIVAKLIGDGMPLKGIAGFMGLSVKTVGGWYLDEIKRKLKVKTITEIVKWAVKNGLTPLCIVLVVVGCTSQPQRVETITAKPIVRKLAPTGVKVFTFPWVYPDMTNAYTWSLQSSTDLKTWTTVTNYPFGYTNDVWWTNDWSTFKAFRMKGHL